MTSISSYGARTRPPNPLSADPEWIHKRFERAVDIIQSLPKSGPIQTGYDDKLLLYAVYKQATEGNIKTSRPGMFDVLGRAKWDAWNKRKDLSQSDAERMYVETLIRILRGYSDRTQAVELIRELENFSISRIQPQTQRPTTSSNLGGRIGGAPRAGSRLATTSRSNTQIYSSDSDSEISDSSTGSSASASFYHDGQDRTRHSSSNLTPQANRTTGNTRHRTRHSNRIAPPPPADLVAPPLPGYGPPRTTTDPPRSNRRGGRRHQQEEVSEGDYSTGSEDDGLHYASVPPTAPSSVIHPAQHSQSRPQTMTMGPPPAPGPAPAPPRSLARGGNNSPSPSIYSLNPRHQPSRPPSQQQQQQGTLLAYHPSQSTSITPLTSSNLLQQRTSTPVPVSVSTSTPIAQSQAQVVQQSQSTTTTAALDSALDRIQTSLTALHERLSILESSPSSNLSSSLLSSSAQLSSNSPISLLLSQSFLRILIILKLRSPPSTASSVRLRSTLPLLVLAVIKRMRKLLGDLVVFGIVITILSRVLARRNNGGCGNVGGRGGVGDWVIDWILARRQLREGGSRGGPLKRISGTG
ncbi:hypothetical protein JCM3765_003474 [Sporobolomyces pararoseus]